MKILFVASEVAPFAKVGGLGDVLGALPKALARYGHDVRIILPLYRQVPRPGLRTLGTPLGVPLAGHEYWCGIAEGQLPDSPVPVYFLEYEDFFNRPGIYSDYGDGLRRFALLSRGALQLCRALAWTPDVIHCNDWQTALIPAYLNTVEAGSPLGAAASILTIHNLAYQGEFGADAFPETGLGWDRYHSRGFEHHGHLNLLKGGIYNATLVTTVSPTYAHEIQAAELGMNLDGVLRDRTASLYGILNGIDDDVWNPAQDPYLAARYDAENRKGKALCKRALQAQLGLPQRPEVPLIGFVGRMVAQKGMDLIAEILPRLLDLDVQVAILGRGETWAEEFFPKLAAFRPAQCAVQIAHSEALAHRIEAGADLFLMPSRYEPCGLNQMYSMRYGTLPIVRATGGLEDTVTQCHEGLGDGTGFKLWRLSAETLFDTVLWALRIYRDRPQLFEQMQHRAMLQDFGWHRAAAQYESLYEIAVARRSNQG